MCQTLSKSLRSCLPVLLRLVLLCLMSYKGEQNECGLQIAALFLKLEKKKKRDLGLKPPDNPSSHNLLGW